MVISLARQPWGYELDEEAQMGNFRTLLLTAFVGLSAMLGGVGFSGAAPLAGLSSAAPALKAIEGSGEYLAPVPVRARRYYHRHYRRYYPHRYYQPFYRPYRHYYAPRYDYYRPYNRPYYYRGW
jgi:hypothetical protein